MTTTEAPPPLFDLPQRSDAFPPVREEVIKQGEVFTRRWIVDLILNWVGYTTDRDLASHRLLDPACGQGAFVIAAAERLSESCVRHGRRLVEAIDAVRAYDLLDQHVTTTRQALSRILAADGWPASEVKAVVSRWVGCADFLLETQRSAQADFVVGNPPYIRIEDLPAARMARYRQVCPTMVGRADIYVGFYEVGLRSLRPGGRLGYICADRWMRNQYGRELRIMIEREYAVEACITMHDVDAFEEPVSAYPAVTVIARNSQGPAVVAVSAAGFDAADAATLQSWALSTTDQTTITNSYRAARLPRWFRSSYSWPAGSPARLAMIEQLNERCRPLEDELTGTRVGIGVATGADAVFVTDSSDEVEAERLLPLVLVRDISSGKLDWSGHYLVNPWQGGGALVDLGSYPRLKSYLLGSESILRSRHVGRRQPTRWYRTIDKVDRALVDRPKLLFPDMKSSTHPVLDPGGYYPHHNLYYVVSDQWDLRVLGGLLLSEVAEAFVEAYAVKMRGGTLRFQAQYLRRIRVPDIREVNTADQAALIAAFEARDREAATSVALKAYGLTELPK